MVMSNTFFTVTYILYIFCALELITFYCRVFFKVPCNSLIICAKRDFHDLVQIPVFNQNIMLARYKSSKTFVF